MRLTTSRRPQVLVGPKDHPEIIASALEQVSQLFRVENRRRLEVWSISGADAYDIDMIRTLGEYTDTLSGVDCEVFTHASPNEFELALVNLGVTNIEDADILQKVDELLKKLDVCRAEVELATS